MLTKKMFFHFREREKNKTLLNNSESPSLFVNFINERPY